MEEVRRDLGFTEEDVTLLRSLRPCLEKYFPKMAEEMAERFYPEAPFHPKAFGVFTRDEVQIESRKQNLQS